MHTSPCWTPQRPWKPALVAKTPKAFEVPSGDSPWTSGDPNRSDTEPPRARTTASGAHVSHRLVPKCITAASTRPSATARSLLPAPPIWTQRVPPGTRPSSTALAAARRGFFESPVAARHAPPA